VRKIELWDEYFFLCTLCVVGGGLGWQMVGGEGRVRSCEWNTENRGNDRIE